MIHERYRTDYEGEFVITESRWSGGKKIQNREWVPNPIINLHTSGRAACIGSNVHRDLFDYTRLQRHKGGLLRSKKLQTYGTGTIAKEMKLDFAVEFDKTVINELVESDYVTENIVYASTRNCLIHPGQFYLIPYNTIIAIEAMVLWMAAFDGHKEIYALGYSNDTVGTQSEWSAHVNGVLMAYPAVKFTFIGEESNVPKAWRMNANVSCMDIRPFISHCDI
jgi:hypothetical protein